MLVRIKPLSTATVFSAADRAECASVTVRSTSSFST